MRRGESVEGCRRVSKSVEECRRVSRGVEGCRGESNTYVRTSRDENVARATFIYLKYNEYLTNRQRKNCSYWSLPVCGPARSVNFAMLQSHVFLQVPSYSKKRLVLLQKLYPKYVSQTASHWLPSVLWLSIMKPPIQLAAQCFDSIFTFWHKDFDEDVKMFPVFP